MRRRPTHVATCAMLLVASSSLALANTAAILDLRDWQANHLNYDDAVIERCFAAKDTWGIYGVGGANIQERQESDLTAEPTVTLQEWRDLLLTTSDADITTHGDGEGSPAAEYYASWSVRDSVFTDIYTHASNGPYTTDQIDGAGTWTIR